MRTGDNEFGLKKIMDMTRAISIILLLLHFYFYCYQPLKDWHYTHPFVDRIVGNIARTGLFSSFHKTKLISIAFLLLASLGAKGRKEEKFTWRGVVLLTGVGLLLFFGSVLVLYMMQEAGHAAIVYILLTALGYLLFMSGCSVAVRIIKLKMNGQVFNKVNETFPQEERLLENEYSINLPARYNLNGKMRKSWINIINPFRGTLILGTPGSGKTLFIIEEVIRQHIEKGFAMFIYDYKMPDLTSVAYHHVQKNKHRYKVEPTFHVIDFDNIQDRCNPIHPDTIQDLADAAECARCFLLGLNKEWIKKQGDFWIESPINFFAAIIWFLRQYEGGKYCTIPHAMEMVQVPYDRLFTLLKTEPQIEILISPFMNAYENEAFQQLEGQLSGVAVSLGRLSSPNLYYVLSGNDFSLDINSTNAPKIVCVGNNPQKQSVYGAVISLYFSSLTRMVNRRGGIPCSIVMDEFTSMYVHGVDTLLATARSNKVALTLAMQDGNQLRLHYGKEMADVLINLPGNIICGQNSGDFAKQISERLGKTLQNRESVSINSNDTSISKSKQLELAVPASTIATLSSGEFVGIVADYPNEKISLKNFHANLRMEKIINYESRVLNLTFIDDSCSNLHMNYSNIKNQIQSLSQLNEY